jgi:hypothetical protein
LYQSLPCGGSSFSTATFIFFSLIETDFFFIFFYQSLPCGGSSFSVVTFVFFLFD